MTGSSTVATLSDGRAIDSKLWFKLPLELRKQWWSETDFGRVPPSEGLERAVIAALDTHDEANR